MVKCIPKCKSSRIRCCFVSLKSNKERKMGSTWFIGHYINNVRWTLPYAQQERVSFALAHDTLDLCSSFILDPHYFPLNYCFGLLLYFVVLSLSSIMNVIISTSNQLPEIELSHHDDIHPLVPDQYRFL